MSMWKRSDIVYVRIYNCDPSRQHGDMYDSEPAFVPAMSFIDFPTEVANHLLEKDTKHSRDDNNFWLTTDEDVFKKCQKQLEDTGEVENPVNPRILANIKTFIVISPEDYDRKQEALKRKAFGLDDAPPPPPTDKPTKGKPAQINV
jgi:hypothetical protein